SDTRLLRRARMRDPAVAVRQRPAGGVREHAADDDGRVRLLHRLRPGHHRAEIDDLAVIFRLVLGPDCLHCLVLLTHLLEARGVDGAMVFHLVLIPAAADPEQEPAAGYLVEGRDELGGLDRVALDDETDAGAEL